MYNEINDIRNINEFKCITFSKFEKKLVKKELIDCLQKNKLESACYWSSELICAGHYSDLWEIIILYISRYIHLGNPKLPIYIGERINVFKTIVTNGYINNELSMRNNIKIRNLFAEIIATLCISRKKHCFQPVIINKKEDFNMTTMATKLNAPNVKYGEEILLDEDPKELYIAINELAFNISRDGKNVVNACYWIEWIIEYTLLCKKRKESCICSRRSFANVMDIYQKNSIWIVWDCIQKETLRRNSPLTSKIISSLLVIFCIRFTPGIIKKRRFLIYFAIAILTEPLVLNIQLFSDKSKIQNVVNNINIIYKDIKHNEEAPKTDYLRVNSRSTLEKTIERLEKIQSTNIIPRI